MTAPAHRERLAEVVEPVLSTHGLELDDLEVIPAGRRSVLRIIVDGDGPKGRGPLLDDIAAATNGISAALDEVDAMSGAYTLEVSSRGTSRPLTEAKHYRRNLTRLVKVNLVDGSTLTGRIMSVDDSIVTLEVTPESVKGNRNPKPQLHEIALDQIAKALIQVELNRSVDEGFDDVDDEDEFDDEDDLDDDVDDEDDLDDEIHDDHDTQNTDPASKEDN